MILVGWFGMGTPLITILFSFFILNQLMVLRKRWLAALVFCLVVAIIGSALVFFLEQAWKTLPDVADKALPAIIHYAQELGVEPTFTDWEGLKSALMEFMKSEFHFLGNFAKVATKQAVLLVIGIVVSVSLFLNPTFYLDANSRIKHNAYAVFCEETAARFHSLYESFSRVMGAQLVISTINTGLTSIFVLFTHFPNAPLVLVLTFLCGLLPIVGNLLSNSLIVGIAFTVSPRLAIWALVFLVTIHKLEYLLNSKIIGERIKNPVWLTLIGLIVGERLMGISGMILAPVLLHYIRVEASQIEVQPPKLGDSTDGANP
jgi:predicted PurR-regulated permease PerM